MTNGFLFVDDLLRGRYLRGVSREAVKAVAENQQYSNLYTLETDASSGRLKIKANYGHSVYFEGEEPNATADRLSKFLRHKAEENGLKLMRGGFLYVQDLLRHRWFHGMTEQQILNFAEKSHSHQFSVETDGWTKKAKIRANYDISLHFEGKTTGNVFQDLVNIWGGVLRDPRIRVLEDGFIWVEDLLQHRTCPDVSTEQLQELVANDSSIRFSIQKDEVTGKLKIAKLSPLRTDKQIANKLAEVLRYNANGLKLFDRRQGLYEIAELLQSKDCFQGIKVEKVVEIVENDPLERFGIRKQGTPLIRANIGDPRLCQRNYFYQKFRRLLKILRHTAESEKLHVLSGGFVDIAELLQHEEFQGLTTQQIVYIVVNCNELQIDRDQTSGKLKVRARWFHTLEFEGKSQLKIQGNLHDILMPTKDQGAVHRLEGGFVYVDELLLHDKFQGVTIEELKESVKDSHKYSLQIDEEDPLQIDEEDEKLKIRLLSYQRVVLEEKDTDFLVARALALFLENPGSQFYTANGTLIFLDDLLECDTFKKTNKKQIYNIADGLLCRKVIISTDEKSGKELIQSIEVCKIFTDCEDNISALTRILQHSAYKEGLHPMKGGFIFVDDLLNQPKLHGITEETIREICHDDHLFTLETDETSDRLKIRANFGHSFEVAEVSSSHENISHKLKVVLRHQAGVHNLTLLQGGFVYIDNILQLELFAGLTEEKIQRVVEEDMAWRFSIATEETSGRLKIRANYGHSLRVDGLEPKVSKYLQLANILRGREHTRQVELMAGGFVYLDRLRQHRSFQGVTDEEIRHLVDSDVTKAFTILADQNSGQSKIRANFGHSFRTKQQLELDEDV